MGTEEDESEMSETVEVHIQESGEHPEQEPLCKLQETVGCPEWLARAMESFQQLGGHNSLTNKYPESQRFQKILEWYDEAHSRQTNCRIPIGIYGGVIGRQANNRLPHTRFLLL